MDIVINTDLTSIPKGAVPIPHQANFYHNILGCLYHPVSKKQGTLAKADEDCYPPIAKLLSHIHNLEGDWLIVSPLHWEATHNDALITAVGHELQLSDEASRQWFDALSAFLAPFNQKLYYHDACTWLIQCHEEHQISAKPVYRLLHQSMIPELKNLDKTLFWQRFITETQMFFSTHPLNKARIGLPSVNGVWVWGAGPLRARVQTPIICDDPHLLPLARLLSTHVIQGPLPQKPDKKSVILFNHLNLTHRIALEHQLKSQPVRWYWNNLAYLIQPKRWWSRIIGII